MQLAGRLQVHEAQAKEREARYVEHKQSSEARVHEVCLECSTFGLPGSDDVSESL